MALRPAVDSWVGGSTGYASKYKKLELSQRDWEQLEFLMALLEPFARFTKVLSLGAKSGPTIHLVWRVYNELFGHLERARNRARGPWKTGLRSAIIAAYEKFKKYYGDTENPKGELLAVAAVLNPSTRMAAYDKDHWKPTEIRKYKADILRFYGLYYKGFEPQRVEVDREPVSDTQWRCVLTCSILTSVSDHGRAPL